MIDRIMDELIGMKNTAIAYFFENLEIGILDIQGPKEQQIDSGKFKGTFKSLTFVFIFTLRVPSFKFDRL
jgi:hypothetical protein